MLAAESLVVKYADGRVALDGVTLRVAEGERVALVGPNGAGKTTLFLTLAGVMTPASGAVRVAGLDAAKPAERKKLPTRVGVVFQNSDDQLFNASVLDDVAFGPLNLGLSPDEARSRAAEALGRVGLTGAEGRVPWKMSGGEKRRVALAGVLAMRPELLLLDEPSMFLDPRGRRELMALLSSLPGTLLVATHDLAMVPEVCGRVVVLDGGKVVADGAAGAILGDAALLERHGL